MTASVEIRYAPDGTARIQPYIRLTDTTEIRCSVYEDSAPILNIIDGAACITITNPATAEATADDVAFARRLAEAAAVYAAEMERLHVGSKTAEPPDAAGPA